MRYHLLLIMPWFDDTAYSRLLMSQHDYMYSGHTCIFMFLGGALPGMLGYGVQFACPLLLLTASRQHYTIDVVVAMVVYTLIRANIATLSTLPPL